MDLENISVPEDAIPKVELKKDEGSFRAFHPSFNMAVALQTTLERHSKSASDVVLKLMHGGYVTSYETACAPLRLISAGQARELSEIIEGLPTSVIESSFIATDHSDFETSLEYLKECFDGLLSTLEYCRKNEFGLICMLV